MRFEEEDLHGGMGAYIGVKKVLFEGGDIQKIYLFDSFEHGRVLAIDKSIQLTEREEGTYHEAITHVPLFTHGNAKRVLIIGGGDGGTAARVLMHKTVVHVKLIEIDGTVVEVSKEYLASVHKNAFNDVRLDLEIGDGARFVNETDERFDVVIVDCSDPDPVDSANNVLFSSEFYADARRVLLPGGIFVMQNGIPNLQREELVNSMQNLKNLFSYATCYLVDAPMYVGGNLALSFATDDAFLVDIPLATLRERFEVAGIDTEYYTPELHKAMFALPKSVMKIVE